MATLTAHVVAMSTLTPLWDHYMMEECLDEPTPPSQTAIAYHLADALLDQFDHKDGGGYDEDDDPPDDEGYCPSSSLSPFMDALIGEVVTWCDTQGRDPFSLVCLYPIPLQRDHLILVFDEESS